MNGKAKSQSHVEFEVLKMITEEIDLSRLRQVVYDEFLEGDYSFYERLADAYRWKEGDVY